MQTPLVDPQNLFRVVNQCFQILQARTEWEWRRHSDVVIVPEVGTAGWDSFQDSEKLIEAGERAARAALPTILSWLTRPEAVPASS
jgi:hypothetical protein